MESNPSLAMPPNWLQSLNQTLSRNAQLQHSKHFSVALVNPDTQETLCDFLRNEQIIHKSEDGLSYHIKPSLLAFLDSRSDIGQAFTHAKASIELCWFFTLTKEKYRLRCKVNLWNNKSITSSNSQLQTAFKSIWTSLNDDELLSFKRACPGDEKKKSGDELLQYEPQVEDQIPSNFVVVELIPERIDHFLMAPPPVVADQRRKPQQYESLAQPFKKDRRFLHTINEEGTQWNTVEINP
ncbi:hypothetical protein FGO68_gene13588 [Halteria grandinella]|uniref:Uncharacterized protein n=1 Tax=Halteria grandinella TaxID=5974 RepID=A0A8J8SYP1_HALGN|nr:hypothetical protein FGO68_gene13588 [Halteria grandinella]